MKFTASAVLLAVLGIADAKKVGTKMTKKAFLRNVMKVDSQGKRRLADDEDEAAILASDSLKFQKCVSVTIGPSDDTGDYLFGDNYYAYTQAGTLSSTMDLAMFSVCSYDEDGSCHYGGDGGDDELYMTPLANWLANTYGIHAQAEEAYCNACEQSQDFCLGDNEEEQQEGQEGEEEQQEDQEGEEEQQGEEDNADEENNEGEEDNEAEEGEEDNNEDRALRKLAWNYVDCDTCQEKGCFQEEEEGENQEDQEEEQDVIEYIEQFLECSNVEFGDEEGRRLEEMQLFATWCCDEDGDGVRLCLYVDENCEVQYTGDSYNDMAANYNEANTYSNSKTELDYTLKYPVTCMGEIEYQALEDNDGDGEADENVDEEEQEAAEFCQNLVSNEQNNEEGAEVIALSTCDYGDEEEEQQDAEEEGDNWGDYDYWYQISANDAQNFETLCYAIQSLNGEGYWTTEEYDEANYDATQSSSSSKSGALSAGAKAGIALIVLGAVAAIAFVIFKFASSKKDSADPKSFKLVDDKKGSLA